MQIKKFIKDKFLPIVSNLYAKESFLNLLLNQAIARSAVGAITRDIDPKRPETWEFSGFSQNGEDGIIEHLISSVKSSNKYFIEIGSGNGLENNTSYLAHISKFAGLQIEGNLSFHNDALVLKPWLVENWNCFVNKESIEQFFTKSLFKNPDLFSIDIDGMDYYITQLLLEKGFRPKIIVVEYNSAFGQERSVTIPYKDDFNMFNTPFPYLYYGVSIGAWKKLFSSYDYGFVSVESNGVNAFFIRKPDFEVNFLEGLIKVEFKENMHQLRLFKKDNFQQFEMIKDLPLVNI